jgi:membrane protein
MPSVLLDLQSKGQRGLSWLNYLSRGWFLLLLESLRDVLSFSSSLYAAATAYFTLFSIFPLILLTVAIASLWFDPVPTGDEILHRLEFAVPALDDLLGANLDRIVEARGVITRLSAIILIWSASSVIYMLTRAMDAIWEEVMVRSAWRHRALAIAITIGISLLLLIGSFVWGFAVPALNTLVPKRLVQVSPYLSVMGSALLSISLFMLLYKMLPHAKLEWRDVVVGAVLAGLLWELAKHAFVFFVSNYLTLSNLVYGSVTAIIGFLTWAYVSSLIFLFGGHLNVRYRRRRQDRRIPAIER